jgi:hypothetical protein
MPLEKLIVGTGGGRLRRGQVLCPVFKLSNASVSLAVLNIKTFWSLCSSSRQESLLFVTTLWTLCSSSRRWRAFGKNWVTNFAISVAALCYGTAAVPIGPRLMVIWTDSVRPVRIVRQIGLQV